MFLRWRTVVIVVAFGMCSARADDTAPRWPTQSPMGLSAGADLLYVRPAFSSNAAYTIVDRSGSRGREFEFEFERAHSFWAAYADLSGWGARFQSMVYDADSDRPKPRLPYDGDNTPIFVLPELPWPADFRAPSSILSRTGLGEDRLWFRSHLRILATDVEITHRWDAEDWSMLASAGGRYQILGQKYGADLDNLGDGITTELQKLRSDREFHGYGPTASLFAEHVLAGSWSVYGGARGSLLVGTQRQTIGFVRSATGAHADLAWSSSENRVDRLLPVAELELGIGCETSLGWLGLFFRGGAVLKSYFNAGGAAGGSGTLHLLGGQISAGVSF
jgi:hypothetical protein